MVESLIGLPAPDFELCDQFGQKHRLSHLRGSRAVLLVFFPFAFTPTCTRELHDIGAGGEEFVNDRVVTLALSCDPLASLKTFAEREGIDHPLLSDFWPHGAVARQYGVFVEARGFANRGTFLVDRDGIVRWSVLTSPSQARSADDYRAALARLV